MREYRDTRIMQFEIYGEFLPTDGTYVTLSDKAPTKEGKVVTDKYGLPVAAVTVTRHPTDLKMSKFLVERGEEVLQTLNPDKLERVGESGETTILQGGTCRMGKDPSTSFLDKDCKSHVVKNLYVVDGSFMPSIGGVPVTLTIAANSFRVASRMIERLKKEGK
jgi:choline dehydrogenase-like flavoprotein